MSATKNLIVAVLEEARQKFGPDTDENREQIARWVQKRVAELQTGTREVHDHKAAAAGERA